MFLKSMELKGFKSFADRTYIDFLPGVTCIVGPNGCGKSNIIDAIRWVLGEQSSASLRARRMEDVIFSGTKHRASLNFASVRLVFSQAQAISPGGLEELSVERILHRSGESTYKINSQAVRLRDLRELFMDTAVGVSGYSLISQGDIDDILKENKQDRRKIFEEASGISLIHYKKEEASRRLLRVEDHYLRIMDILEEVTKQREPLRLERDRALSYQALSKRAREIDLFYAQQDHMAYEGQEEDLSRELGRLVYDLEKLLEEKESLQSMREKEEEKRRGLASEYGLYQDLLGEKTSKRDEIYLDLRLKEERLRQVEREEASQERDYELFDNGSSQAAMARAQDKLEVSRKRLEELREEIKEKGASLDYQSRDARSLELKKEETLAKLQQIDSEKAHLEKQSQLQGLELKGYEEDKINLTRSLEELGTEKLSLEADGASLERGRFRLERSRREILEEKRGLEEEKNLLATRRAEISSAIASLDRNIKLYEEWELEGEKDLNQLKNRIGGSILHHGLKPEKGFEKALEAALGPAINSLDIRSVREALEEPGEDYLVNLLYELPERASASDPASLGRMADFVEGSEELIGALLASSLVYRNLEEALKGPSQARRITLAGQRLEGGFYYPWDPAPSPFEIGLKLKENRQEKKELEEDLEELDKKISQGASLLIENKAREEAFLKEEASLLEEEEAYKKRLSHLEGDERVLLYKLEEKSQDLEKLRGSLESQGLRLGELAKIQDRLSGELLRLEEALKPSSGQDLAKLQEKLLELRLEEAALGEETKRWQAEVESLRAQSEELDKREKYRQEQKRLREEEKLSLDGELDGIREDYAGLQLEIKKLDEKAFGLKKELDSLRLRSQESQARREALDDRLYEIQGEKAKKEVELGRLEERKSALSQEIWRLYELSMLQVKDLKLSCDEPRSARRKIRQEMQKLEPVNLQAPREFEEIDERHSFLSEQLADIEESKADLLRTIGGLERRMKEDFLSSFEAIRENFKEIFSHLFRGGQGDILLEDPQDILTSDIIILASPPGKRLQHMNLLSGGEKALTAIALLFAVLKTKPAPFYVLDEIEAALDDINIQRFGTFLEEFSIGSQFILITHRKGTMEFADALYGVSMEEKGISSLVSLKMEE